MAPNIARNLGQTFHDPAEYPTRKYKFDIKESDSNMLNSIF